MRTPVISRFVRRSVATTAATLAIGVALPVLSGGTTAWACGTDRSAPAAEVSEPRHATDPVTAFIPRVPTSVTAGGDKVEIGVEQANFTGAPYQRLAPGFALHNPDSDSRSTPGVNLRVQDVTVDVMIDGAWKRLPLHLGCDPTIVADTSALEAPLADGHAHRYLFRIGLAAKTPAAQKKIQILSGGKSTTLTIDHPVSAQPSSVPTAPEATPTTVPTPAVVPAAVVGLPAATPTAAVGAAPQAARQLASTGPATPTGFLFGSAAAMVALGGGVMYAVRRIAKR